MYDVCTIPILLIIGVTKNFIIYRISLMRTVPPHITPFDFGGQTLNAGESASTMCSVNKGDQPVNTAWFVNGKPVEEIRGVSVIQLGRQGSVLSMASVDAEHSGKYTCKATNWAGSAYYAAVLSINGTSFYQNHEDGLNYFFLFPYPIHFSFRLTVAPHIVPFEFAENPVNSGETASVQCTVVKGDTPIEIAWFLNGRPIAETLGVTTVKNGKRVSSLTVDNVDASHAGSYTCRAGNVAGSADYSTSLSVNGVGGFAIFKI